MPFNEDGTESEISPQERESKPAFLYHGSNASGIAEILPQKRYTPGGQEVPDRIYAGDLPAFAAAHSFPWDSSEGFVLSIENGRVLFRVPNQFKDRLIQKVYLYKLESKQFDRTSGEGTGHTYHSIKPIVPTEVKEFNSVPEAIEHFGGKVTYF